jgi:hypothetical protein
MMSYRWVGILALGIGCRAEHGIVVQRIGSDAVQPFAIVGGDVLVDDGKHIERLAPDGAVRWRSDARGKWAMPHSGVGSAFVVGVSTSVDEAPLLDVNLDTGLSKTRCTIDPSAFAEWYRFGEVLIVANGIGSVERIDPTTCQDMWWDPGNGNPVDHSTRDEFWVAGARKVRALAITDGAKREMDAGTWVSITPDGRTLVTDFDASVAAFDTETVHRTWTYPGRPHTAIAAIAASDRWIAVASKEYVTNSRVTLTVIRRSDGTPVWSHRSSQSQFLGYIAAGGDWVAYYDSEDASLHAVHLPDGKTGIVQKFESGVFLSTERAGLAPAVPDKAPRIDGDIMIVYDTPTARAYRVRPRP